MGWKNWGSGFCASLFFLTHMVENLQHLWKAGSAAKKGWPCLPKYFLIWCSQGPALAAVCVHLHNYNFVSLLRSIVGNRWYPCQPELWCHLDEYTLQWTLMSWKERSRRLGVQAKTWSILVKQLFTFELKDGRPVINESLQFLVYKVHHEFEVQFCVKQIAVVKARTVQ